jgi:hypothetical protein
MHWLTLAITGCLRLLIVSLLRNQFTDWPEQGVPKSGEGFIDFIGQVHKTKEQFGQEGPITVHCR